MKSLHLPNTDDLEAISPFSSSHTTEERDPFTPREVDDSIRQKKSMHTSMVLGIITISAILVMVALIFNSNGKSAYSSSSRELQDTVHQHHQHQHLNHQADAAATNDIISKDASSSSVTGNEASVENYITTDPGVEGYQHITFLSIVDDGTTTTSQLHSLTSSGPPPSAPTATTTSKIHHQPTIIQSTVAQRHLNPANEMVVPLNESKQQQLSFRRGDLAVNVPGLGIKVCTGMQVRVVARAGQKIPLANNGGSSKLPFHSMPDGATVIPSGNGYIYISNSEMKSNRGGVYGVYFSNAGHVVDYQPLLLGSTRNCGGGRTPWNTWISCEEYGNGQCWQIDPTNRNPPQITQLGGSKGGNYESVAVDNRNLSRPIFFLTEDAEFGALRRYTPPPPPPGPGPKSSIANWNTLHRSGGNTDYLMFLDSKHFKWTANEHEGRNSQFQNYRNVEGIDFHNGYLYFVSKKLYTMYVLDLDTGTYTTSSTKFGGGSGSDAGEFWHSPDQIIRNNGGAGGGDKYIYMTEDGGNSVGVYAICRQTGEKYAIFEAYNGKYKNDETTGLAFSPDGRKMYAAFQDCGCNNSESGLDPSCGCLLEFSRKDGLSFDGSTLDIKFHLS